MYDHEWDHLKYFKRSEIEGEGNPYLLKFDLMMRLDNLREKIGQPIIITSSTAGNHSSQSEHYMGRAIDFVIRPNDKPYPLLDCFLHALQVGFSRVGIYPDWHYHGQKVGGFHVDIHPQQRLTWIGFESKKTGKMCYDYYVTQHKLEKHKII